MRSTTEGNGSSSSSSSSSSNSSQLNHKRPASPPSSPGATPPRYGSQEYWEDRYKRLKGEGTANAAPDPFHAWYFNYDELAPLILPLILGDGEDNDEDNENNEVVETSNSQSHCEEKNSSWKELQERSLLAATPTPPGREGSRTSNEKTTSSSEGEEDEWEEDENDFLEEDEEDDDAEEQAPKRIGLAKDGPISILEIGCGDVPLGRDILNGISKMELLTGAEATHILKKVVCIDYSKNVIDTMKAKRDERKTGSSVELIYEVADARKLPYDELSFDLLLEKGALDAMLSDTKDGNGNCKAIVAECARVLSVNGYLMIISHLNAHVQSGLEWLDNVVVPGLRNGAPNYEWRVEVHGNAADIPEVEEGEQESPGPAVYIIRKGEKRVTNGEGKESTPPTIPLKFFTY